MKVASCVPVRKDPLLWLKSRDEARAAAGAPAPAPPGDIFNAHVNDRYYHPLRKAGWQHHQHGYVAVKKTRVVDIGNPTAP